MRGKVVGATGAVAGLFCVCALTEEVFFVLLREDLADCVAGWGRSCGFLAQSLEGSQSVQGSVRSIVSEKSISSI